MNVFDFFSFIVVNMTKNGSISYQFCIIDINIYQSINITLPLLWWSYNQTVIVSNSFLLAISRSFSYIDVSNICCIHVYLVYRLYIHIHYTYLIYTRYTYMSIFISSCSALYIKPSISTECLRMDEFDWECV